MSNLSLMKFYFIDKEKFNNLFKKENIFFLFLILIIFFLDRLSKDKIINNFNENIFFVNNYVNIDLVWNNGIGFGLLSSDSSIFYNLITLLIIIVILVLIYVFMNSKKIDKLIFSIIIGGAIGNVSDRVIYKAVPDFIDLHYMNFHWFTFNVADIFISIGVIIFITKSLFIK